MAANKKNLKSLADRTTEEQRAIAIKGGKKSGEVRKEKRIITDTLEMLLNSQIQDDEVKEQLEARGVKEHTELKAMCLGMVKEARKNPSAFKEILDRIEGKVTDKVEMSGTLNNPFEGLTEDELRKLANRKGR
jgi:uncharacterized protein YjbK